MTPLFLLVLASCTRDSAKDDSGEINTSDDSGTTGKVDDTGTTTVTKDCEIGVDSVFPEDGESDAYFRTRVEATLEDEDQGAVITVSEGTNPVSGTSTVDATGTLVSFEATNGFAANTSHTATLDWCGGSETWQFTTNELGEPLDEGVDSLVGNTYLVPLGSGRFVEPAGIDTLLEGALALDIHVNVAGATDTTIDLITGFADGDKPTGQDTCIPTQAIDTADFSSNPYFQVGPTDLSFGDVGVDITVFDMKLAGTFASDGATIGGVEMSGQLDFREIGPEIGVEASVVCVLAELKLGISCQACGDGEEYCLDMRLDSVEGTLLKGAGFNEVDQLNCHVDCADSKDNKDCVL